MTAGRLLGCLLLAALLPLRPTPAARAPAVADAPVVDLAGASWTLDGEPPATPPVTAGGGPDDALPRHVLLPMPASNRRWAMRFGTDAAGTVRLGLEWVGAPDGLLYEIVLDGEPLSPARDAWRPTPRALSADLGARWLGAGGHLLEFVARERSADGCLRLVSLRLGPP